METDSEKSSTFGSDPTTSDVTTDSDLSSSDKTVDSSGGHSIHWNNELLIKPGRTVTQRRNHPYGSNRDTMGNYIGPGGDPGISKTDPDMAEERVVIEYDVNSQASDDSADEDEAMSEELSGEYTVETRRGRPTAYVKHVLKVQTVRLKPHLVKGAKRVREEKNELVYRMKPHLRDARAAGRKVSHVVKKKGTKIGVGLALRGVRYITGRPSVHSTINLTGFGDDEEVEKPYEDPFDFDLAQLKVMPVEISKLVIATEPLADGKGKTHTYFEGQKKARLDAVIGQAASRHTKEIAEKLKKNEGKLKKFKQDTHSIGPRIHVGFKCDTEKQLLTIRIIEATGLPGKDSNGLSDPYAIVTLKPDADIPPLTTRIIGKTINPKWKEVFELSGVPAISVLARQILHIAVYDYDQIGSDDLVGYVDIGFATYDLAGGTDTWFDLRTKENEELFKVRGHILVGLRYDEKHEQLTVFLERCHGLERTGWLMLKGVLHINGFLVKEEKAKIEETSSINPELKRRMVFTKIKHSLLEEYTITIYMAFRRYFLYYKFFGQNNLSSKSKIKDEETLWAEAVKVPGEAAFKQLAIQPFVGLVKKPWVPLNDEPLQEIGFLHVTFKTSDMGSGMVLTFTLNKAEELRMRPGKVILVEIYLIKGHLRISYENTLLKKVGQKITPIEEQFDFPVEMEDIQQVELLAVVFLKTLFGREPLGQVCLSLSHGRSTVEEIDLWQACLKTTGYVMGKRLNLRPLYPEVTFCPLSTADEMQVPFCDPSLLPGKDKLGVILFSLKYDESKEQLSMFIEMVDDFSLSGTYYVEGYLWDLSKSIRKRERSAKMKPDGFILEFKEMLRFKNLHSSFYDSHHLCIRVMKKRFMRSSIAVGQAVIKIEKPL